MVRFRRVDAFEHLRKLTYARKSRVQLNMKKDMPIIIYVSWSKSTIGHVRSYRIPKPM